jgi:2-oxoisovalerate dehydrogenase E1 component beta subunit
MERDPAVFLLGEDIAAYGGAFKVTEGMLARFGPDRVIDTPVSEQAIVGAAAGAAHMGLRPVCEMQFADFIACAYDMLTNYVATARYRPGCRRRWWCGARRAGTCAGGRSTRRTRRRRSSTRRASRSSAPPRQGQGLIKAASGTRIRYYFEHKYLYRRVRNLPEGRADPDRSARLARRAGSRSSPGRRWWRARNGGSAGGGGWAGSGSRPPHAPSMDDEAIMASVRNTNRVLRRTDTATGRVAGRSSPHQRAGVRVAGCSVAGLRLTCRFPTRRRWRM